MMHGKAKLLINQTEFEMDLSDMTALRDHVLQLAEGIHKEVATLEQAKEIVRNYTSLEEAISAKEAQVNRLCGLAIQIEIGVSR